MRKVYLQLEVKLIIEVEEGVEVSDVIQEMDYSFISKTDNAEIIETEVLDYEVTDSK